MLSKILLALLVIVLVVRFGLLTRLRHLKPRLDRAVNLIIIGLVVIYVGHLIWWLTQSSGAR
ncbi:MAG TPA: hypothetical protein VJN18_05550 [Polyangiaceae bacterium]|nr:hypothetical protein [Polyangiaceae bacterium]